MIGPACNAKLDPICIGCTHFKLKVYIQTDWTDPITHPHYDVDVLVGRIATHGMGQLIITGHKATQRLQEH